MGKYGRIPKRLKVFLRPTTHYNRPYGAAVECYPAFVTDADRPQTHDTARRWATRPQYDPTSPVIPPDTKVEGIEQDNKPLNWVTLVGTDARQEGGFAFKVVTPQGWLVDLRNEEFYEVLFKKGIPKTGKMEGPFQWVVNGSQMRLTLIGSKLYKEIAAADKTLRMPRKGKIKIADLEVGGVYSSNNRGGSVYLGRCRVEGKLKCAWLYLGYYTMDAGYQSAYDRMVRVYDLTVTLTTDCSYTDHVGRVRLEPDLRKQSVRFQDGSGSRMFQTEISEW